MYLVSRTRTFAKLFFIVSFTGLFMYTVLAFYTIHAALKNESHTVDYAVTLKNQPNWQIDELPPDLKYILVWSITDQVEFFGKRPEVPMLPEEGQAPFLNADCSDLNCYITTQKDFLGNYTNFDAIIFNTSVLHNWYKYVLPKERFPQQKYIFYAKEPAEHPICNAVVNRYFNWTWTYKLGSDIFAPFIEVKDLFGTVIAPRTDVAWVNKLSPTNIVGSIDEVTTKTKAVAWMMTNCEHLITSKTFTRKFKKALSEHSLVLDIFGCDNQECPKDGCLAAIEKDYYFYLVYEPRNVEDYVTDEVLKAYHHDAVPIIIGGADYTKFLPDDSYINYQGYDEYKLASVIAYTIRTPSKYREFFQWKKFYTIHKVDERKGLCQLCYLLNNVMKMYTHSTYVDFRKWWYRGSLKENCYPKGAELLSEVLDYTRPNKSKS